MRPLTESDLLHLRRCVELAREALDSGDEPFGSLLVDPSGKVAFEDRNRVADGDSTRHPEFEIARWAAANVAADERPKYVVYTSGEHCAMCSAAHAWVGLGEIVFATSSEQLIAWLDGWGAPRPPVAPLPITDVAPGIRTVGPVADLAAEVKSLHARRLTS